MDNTTISIGDLDRRELRFVLRTFVRAIGAHEELARLADANGPVLDGDVLDALNLSTWPTSESTEVELAWLSKPISHPDLPRLKAYSVFWSLSNGPQLWIGKTPQRPRARALFLSDVALISAITRMYRIKTLAQPRSNRLASFVKRNWPQIMIYTLLTALAAGAFTYSYFRRGFVLWTFILPLIPIGTFLYGSFGPRLLGFVAYDLIISLALFFGLPYLVWSPSEHLPYGSDTEYPFMASLAASMSLGFGVVMLKALLDKEEETLLEIIRNRFRYLRRLLVLMSEVALIGYPVFLTHTYAVHRVFVEGDHMFVVLIIFCVIGMYGILHSLLRQ